jgi:hypothetical protein
VYELANSICALSTKININKKSTLAITVDKTQCYFLEPVHLDHKDVIFDLKIADFGHGCVIDTADHTKYDTTVSLDLIFERLWLPLKGISVDKHTKANCSTQYL